MAKGRCKTYLKLDAGESAVPEALERDIWSCGHCRHSGTRITYSLASHCTLPFDIYKGSKYLVV